MSEFNVGDKVYAEVVIIAKDNGFYAINADGNTENPYVHFVISEKYLHNIPEKTYEDGLNEAWEVVKRIGLLYEDGGFKTNELMEIFGRATICTILKENTLKEAVEKIRAWENSKEIHVGDIVTDSYGNKDVVTGVGGQKETDTICILRTDGYAGTVYKQELTKTGRTINIESLLKQIGGTE